MTDEERTQDEDPILDEFHRRQQRRAEEDEKLGLTDRQIAERIHRSGQEFFAAHPPRGEEMTEEDRLREAGADHFLLASWELLRGLVVLKDRPYAIDRFSLDGHQGCIHGLYLQKELISVCKVAGLDAGEIKELEELDGPAVLFPHKDQDEDWEDPIQELYYGETEDNRSPEEKAKAMRRSGERFLFWANLLGKKIKVVPPPPPGFWDPRTSETLIPAVQEMRRVLRESEDQLNAEARLREAGAGDSEIAAFVHAEGLARLIQRGAAYKASKTVVAELGPLLPQLIERCKAAGVETVALELVQDWLRAHPEKGAKG